MMLRKKQSPGFSLIEMSVVLVIVAVLVGSGISAGLRGTESTKISATYNRVGKLEDAVIAYLRINKRLPCPADASLANTNASFGVEDCVATSQTTCVSADCSAAIRVGMIPTATLGLPVEFAFDEWSHRITYAVNINFTDRSSLANATGNLTILGYDDTVIKTSTAAYVILSHGRNGHGAWKEVGSSTRVNAGVSSGPELQNADDLSTQKSFDVKFRQALFASDFDDILVFKNKNQMFWAAGAATVSEACELAKRTLCPTDNTILPAAGPKRGPVGCEVDPGTTTFDQDCVDRQTRLARAIYESGLCFGGDADFSDCR